MMVPGPVIVSYELNSARTQAPPFDLPNLSLMDARRWREGMFDLAAGVGVRPKENATRSDRRRIVCAPFSTARERRSRHEDVR